MSSYRGMQGATTSNVAGSASAVTLLAQNPSRKAAIVYNDSAAILYLKIEAVDASAASASSTSFSYLMQPGATVELMTDPFIQSMISGIWASATGNARITEIA